MIVYTYIYIEREKESVVQTSLTLLAPISPIINFCILVVWHCVIGKWGVTIFFAEITACLIREMRATQNTKPSGHQTDREHW